VDGAHNPAAIRVVRAFLEEEKMHPLLMVFGVLKDKDWEQMLELIAPLASGIIVTRPENDRAAEPKALAAVASRFCERVEVAETMPEALRIARSLAVPHDTILVTGSLYTAAAALRALGFTSLF
jgi:dihydrofolate synthase/folylpolyglutamate synthase